MKYGGCVYILTNKHKTVLYIGVTSRLRDRITEHKTRYYADSFTSKYNCNQLVYFETFPRIEEAIIREKQMKLWKRSWKIRLVNSFNPEWNDLYDDLE